MDLTHDHYDQRHIEVMINPYGFGYAIRIFQEQDFGEGRKVFVADKLTMIPIKAGDMIPNALTVDNHAAQELMDGLWHVGVRPSNGEGNVGQIGAMREHLGDLRMDKKFLQDLILKETIAAKIIREEEQHG